MKILKEEKKIILSFESKTDGKFRIKQRNNNFAFGESFAIREKENICPENIYLEWQIGYDAIVKDVENNKKETSLIKKSFKGANNKNKYLYELSEIIFFLKELNYIKDNDIQKLLNEVQNYTEFLDEKDIEINKKLKDVKVNNLSFKETETILPTFFYYEEKDNSQIEISTQKQQYATGVQPMVYYCIPLSTFKNGKDFINKRGQEIKDNFIYEIDKNNYSNFVDLIKIFAMCSKNHNYDICEILKLIINYNN